jgi:hypothetical protein
MEQIKIKTDFSLYYKSFLLTQETFPKIRKKIKNLDTIIVSYSLKGGFPDFGKILGQLIVIYIILFLLQGFLSGTLGAAKVFASEEKKQGVMETIYKIGKNMNWFEEMFYGSIAFYLYTSVTCSSILMMKEHHCGNFQVDWKIILLYNLTPLFLILFILFWLVHSKPKNVHLYNGIFIFLFFLSSFLTYSYTNKLLNEFKTKKEDELNLLSIIIEAIFAYSFLRILLHIKFNPISLQGIPPSGFTGILFFMLTNIFAFTVSVPNYLQEIIHIVSSQKSICQKKTT